MCKAVFRLILSMSLLTVKLKDTGRTVCVNYIQSRSWFGIPLQLTHHMLVQIVDKIQGQGKRKRQALSLVSANVKKTQTLPFATPWPPHAWWSNSQKVRINTFEELREAPWYPGAKGKDQWMELRPELIFFFSESTSVSSSVGSDFLQPRGLQWDPTSPP